MAPVRYEHRQIGYATIAALALGILVVLAVVAFAAGDPGALWITGIVALILACCLVLFSTLSVSVSDDELRVWFGPGLIHKRFRASEIRAVHTVRNRWWYGWGIRLTPYGWMFNVSGLDAVEIERTDGKGFRIGTDEPKKLEAAIRKVAGAGD
jgi:hypothetical protein